MMGSVSEEKRRVISTPERSVSITTMEGPRPCAHQCVDEIRLGATGDVGLFAVDHYVFTLQNTACRRCIIRLGEAETATLLTC